MVPIPYARTYKTTVRGKLLKLVRCEECQYEYVYLFEQTAEGEGTSLLFLDNEGAKERSAAQAEAQLRQDLEQGCAIVPCPACGRIQEHMKPLARQYRYRWFTLSAVILLLGAAILVLPAGCYTFVAFVSKEDSAFMMWAWGFVGGLVATALVLFVLKGILAARYDPNAAPVEARKQEGQRVGMSKEAFLKLAKGKGE